MLTRYRRSLVLVALVAGLTALVGAAPAEAQTDYTISGRVVGASTGNPLPGANARIVGASFGTATDAEGRFSFTARLQPGQYQIRVSFVGYKTATRSIELGDQQEVTLDPFRLAVSAAQFEELVVTGQAGPTQRKKLGNAISTIDGAELEEAPSTTTLGALQGKLAGVNIQQNTGNPAGGTSIRLRGTSTVLGTADPLIVLDGVIISNDSPTTIDIGGGGGAQNRLLDLNPQDIARIEVVKGAAAAALYGSRANNGVVQIFTKMGDEGETEITYNTRVQTQAIRKTLDVNKAKNDQGQFLNNNGKPLPSDQKRWDYQDFIFDRAYGTEQYLSVSGGSEDTRFFTSAGFTNNQGIVSGTNFRRYNATARIRHTVNDWINIKAGARYARSASDDVPNGGVRATYGALTGFIFGPNTKDPRPKGGQYPNVTLFSNPLEVTNRFKFGQTTNRFIGDFQVDLSPLKGLSINSIVGLDTYEQVGTAYVPPNNTTLQFGGGFSERAEASNLQVNADLNVRYETDILPSLSSTSLIGASLQYENEESFTGNSRGLPLLTEVASAGSRDRNFGERRLPRSLYGIFGQQSFGLSDMLFVTGALRFDASSVFGAAERWQTYPKLSASYVLSEHDGWQETFGSVVSNFKLRGSIGWSGGLTSIGPFDRFTNYNSASFGEKPGLQPSSQLGASDIKPERQREIEFGVDASFLNDRLGVRFTYYRQRTTDLLLRRSVAPTTGFNTRLANVGTLQNNGIELRVRGVPVSTDAFRWTSTATYSRNQNEVTGIPTRGGNVGAVTLPVSFGVSQARNGYSLGVYFGSAFKRNDQGQVVDTKGNVLVEDENGYWRPKNCDVSQSGCTGIPAQADSQKVVGNPQPDFTGSWINQFAIGDNLSVRVQFDAEIGQDVFNFFRRIGAAPFFGTLNDYERELEGDLPSGYNAAAFGIFEHWVEDGSYVKLREVAINYTIEPNGLPLESITLNASGRNLLSFDNYSGYDPETNVAGQSTGVRGFDFGTVPIPRTYSLGVRVKF